MNNLGVDELMKMIQVLHMSHNTEQHRMYVKMRCLEELLLENVFDQRTMTNYAQCKVCDKYICDYKTVDESYDDGNPDEEINIVNCHICSAKICIECSINVCCPKCMEVRFKADEITHKILEGAKIEK